MGRIFYTYYREDNTWADKLTRGSSQGFDESRRVAIDSTLFDLVQSTWGLMTGQGSKVALPVLRHGGAAVSAASFGRFCNTRLGARSITQWNKNESRSETL